MSGKVFYGWKTSELRKVTLIRQIIEELETVNGVESNTIKDREKAKLRAKLYGLYKGMEVGRGPGRPDYPERRNREVSDILIKAKEIANG